MTEEEKQRLNELMLEMEDQDDKNNKSNNLTIHDGNEENPTYIVEYNPYSVSLADGDGFTPDKSGLSRKLIFISAKKIIVF